MKPGWDEPDVSTEADCESLEVGDGVWWRVGPDDAKPAQFEIEHEDFVGVHDVGGAPFRVVPCSASEFEHAPRGDGVESEALSQVVRVIEPAVFDARAGLEGAETLLDGIGQTARRRRQGTGPTSDFRTSDNILDVRARLQRCVQ